MNAIILGDKFRKGQKSKGCCALIQKDRETLLQHQIESIRLIDPKTKIYYIAGFDYNRLLSFINKNNIYTQLSKVVCNHDYAKFNESYSLNIGIDSLDNLDDDLLIINGYYCPPKILKHLDRTSSSVFICSKEKSKLGCTINNNKIEHIFFGLQNYIQDIYYVNKKDIHVINSLVKLKMNNNFLFEIINTCIDNGCYFTNFNLDTIKKNNIKNYDRYQKNSCIQQ